MSKSAGISSEDRFFSLASLCSLLRMSLLAGGGIVFLLWVIAPKLFAAGPDNPSFVWAVTGLCAVYLCVYGLMSCPTFSDGVRVTGTVGVAIFNGAGATMAAIAAKVTLLPAWSVLSLALAACLLYAGLCWPVYLGCRKASA